jgi:hypothetical protein
MESKPTMLLLYRNVLKTMMYVFKGDYNSFHMLRISIRREIEKSKDLNDRKEIKGRMMDLEEIRLNLLNNVMQGKLQDGGFYRYKARPEHIQSAGVKPMK